MLLITPCTNQSLVSGIARQRIDGVTGFAVSEHCHHNITMARNCSTGPGIYCLHVGAPGILFQSSLISHELAKSGAAGAAEMSAE
ncbi:uncharacterized protein B0I36DRAFT_315019 [Microdochium trichocladiopsis]|uniref:Uncharacterized protein n=1 Tax=Microdochium trichocladiopsis TaxID=1682393 RepID=A0A9P8YEK8_9PEZI|nr:uncharacterized protein B0I36DRAFT_315019 [Microdochium trichocladiopsis]KAH7037893.1 hypothetical protein B0I36DRAFT_315019 [Microdochium trichocladiopsis]